MSLTAAKTARSLMTATYYCTGVSGSRILGITDAYGTPTVPVVRPFYKPGATLYFPDDNLVFTVQAFAGGSALQTDQASPVYFGPSLPQTTNDSSARARGSGLLVPDALHFIYLSVLDDAGSPDYYPYVDTIDPERGVHPYTRDKAIGSFKTAPLSIGAAGTVGRLIPQIETRVKYLEGVLRAGRAAASSVQDDRLAKLVARLAALETWANGTGHFGTPPAVGTTTVYTEDQFIQAGDQA